MTYKTMAVISDDVVSNTIWCDITMAETYSKKDTGGRPVRIGDAYENGKFYRDGVEVLTPLEEAQKRIAELEAINADQTAALSAIYSGEV